VNILNIAAYQFVPIPDTKALRDHIAQSAHAHALKGTVLLAEEGINLFLAGESAAVHGFLSGLKSDPRFADLAVKFSESPTVPFKKLLVKIKREIIRMDHPQVKPIAGRAASVDAVTLKRWLDAGHDDAGREIALLDTRNAFEADVGTFDGTVDFRISKFTEFPAAVAAHKPAFEGKTVVTFCTGGIRCEKAALYMRDIGMQNVLQLDGGILKYFEDVGQAHYSGGCFVFDERRAVDSALAPTPAIPT
jgi:UPF0176 protein